MKLVTTRSELNQYIQAHKNSLESIGFVPTMGFLHEGHLSLVKKAREQNDVVVMSIFVNPLQFGPNEDFETYPRDLERDRSLAENAGVDYLFVPTTKEMYPTSVANEFKVTKRVNVLCGKKREGHFDGVVTVLTKLFHLVRPNRAYFGMKDAQQIAVVDGLVSDYFFPIDIVPVETVREVDGLAKSSRNVYLTDKERKEAPELYQSLLLASKTIESGEKDTGKIINTIKTYLKNHTSGTIDYVEIYDYPKLQNIETLNGKIIIALAVQFTKARLIDNIILDI